MKNTCIPRTAVLEMTYACNHACLFCSVPWESPRNDYDKRLEMSIDEWKKCVDILLSQNVSILSFSGGEPLLKSGLADLIHYVRSQKETQELAISIITNGELIDHTWAALFKKCGLSVTVSLPGRETFGYLTGGGNYQTVLNSIQLLSETGIDVVISICVTRKNLPELFETIADGFLHGAKQLLLNRFLPGGRGLSYTNLMLNKNEVLSMLNTADEACSHANTFGSTGTEMPKCILEKEYKMLSVSTKCSGGDGFFAIDPSGFVRPCNHSPVRLGKYTDLAAAVATDYWQTFKHKNFLPQMCRGCALSLSCDGGCREAAHILTGDINSLDPIFTGGIHD